MFRTLASGPRLLSWRRPVAAVSTARHFSFGSRFSGSLSRYGTVVNIATGAYLGTMIVCGGSLYFIYQDAQKRQYIPFELPFAEQLNTIKAISKDDVMKNPRYAVKHYRRVLLDFARAADPDLSYSETLPDGSRNYMVPLLTAEQIVHLKSRGLANFYVDMVLRYAKALLAKGKLDVSVTLLKAVVDDDALFYKLGDAEKLCQCSRALSKVCPEVADRIRYLERSVSMLQATFQNIRLNSDYLLEDKTLITDELISSLNALAASFALQSKQLRRRDKDKALSRALNIYLANLSVVSAAGEKVQEGELTQRSFPLFDVSSDNIRMLEAEMKAHVSEILWAKGYKKDAIAWGEEVVEEIYFDHASLARAAPILVDVLENLKLMYTKVKDQEGAERCAALRKNLRVFDTGGSSSYDRVVEKFTRVIYYKGPLGILEKALKERFGGAQPLPNIEDYEDEDEE